MSEGHLSLSKPEPPHWVKRLKRLKCEEEVWWLRIPSEFDAMRSLTSHLGLEGGDGDMMFDGWCPRTLKLYKVVDSIMLLITSGSNFSCRLDMWILYLRIIYFWRLCCYFYSFMTQNSEKMSLLVRIFGETPSRHIVTCLLLCAARDLKSSQCAVHVVGTVHCNQRNQRQYVPENDQIFWSTVDSWNLMWNRLSFVYHIRDSESIVLL